MEFKNTLLRLATCIFLASSALAANPLKYIESHRTPIWVIAMGATAAAAYADYRIAKNENPDEFLVKDWLKALFLFKNAQRKSIVSKISPWLIRGMLLADVALFGCEIAIKINKNKNVTPTSSPENLAILKKTLDGLEKPAEDGTHECQLGCGERISEKHPVIICQNKESQQHAYCSDCARGVIDGPHGWRCPLCNDENHPIQFNMAIEIPSQHEKDTRRAANLLEAEITDILARDDAPQYLRSLHFVINSPFGPNFSEEHMRKAYDRAASEHEKEQARKAVEHIKTKIIRKEQ